MLRWLARSESITTSHIGAFCPYWILVDSSVVVGDNAAEIINSIPEPERTVDPTAILELLCCNYVLGNRTLVQKLQRMPWRARLSGDGTITRLKAIPHGETHVEPGELAKKLRELLEEELWNAVKDTRRVWLLLSGGLDSRVVAGVLKRLEPSLHCSIGCVSWGKPNSRDVEYAKRIAFRYDWSFVHVQYDSELLWRNIQRAATWGGAEVAGIHLHGMEWFEQASSDDLVIAASFGDGIGRAEYNSQHLLDITPRVPTNVYDLVHPNLVPEAVREAEHDLRSAWAGEEESPQWVKAELDMQENYMRRMISHAMDYIRQFCKLHQAFTSEKVVSYVWSVAPNCRGDETYDFILRDIDPWLRSLPWARTGVAFDGSTETNARLTKFYHRAGDWLRGDLREKLESLVFSDGLFELGVFYKPAVSRFWKRWLQEPDPENKRGEIVAKIAGIELARRAFNLQPCRQPTSWKDSLTWVPRLGQKAIRRLITGG
ncbi:MAG: asparagine synthase-related protein [Armatimonadota bacterium]|nr:asparagine synthase-related protein [Armatimonadota bacterium]